MNMSWRSALLMGVVVAVLAAPGCWPPNVIPVWESQPAVSVVFEGDCESEGLGGVEVTTWDQIKFCNESVYTVIVMFPDGYSWIGRNSLRLIPGECATLRVRSGPTAEYMYTFVCQDENGEEKGMGGGPIIKEP